MQLLRVAEPSAPLSKELYNICCRVNHLPFYMYIWKYVTNLLNLINGMHLFKCRTNHTFSQGRIQNGAAPQAKLLIHVQNSLILLPRSPFV